MTAGAWESESKVFLRSVQTAQPSQAESTLGKTRVSSKREEKDAIGRYSPENMF